MRVYQCCMLFETFPIDVWVHILQLIPCVRSLCRLARVSRFFQPMRHLNLLHIVLQERIRRLSGKTIVLPTSCLSHMSQMERAWQGFRLVSNSSHSTIVHTRGLQTVVGRGAVYNILNFFISRRHCIVSHPTPSKMVKGYYCRVDVCGRNGIVLHSGEKSKFVTCGYVFYMRVNDWFEMAQHTNVVYTLQPLV